MASFTAATRASSLVARHVTRRCFTTSPRAFAAQNFTMPALSPTMTEGNIAEWKVKEGDTFSAGDVLLEIETDKATMDVEAQDDGVMFKIMTQGGAKAVPVGTRIAVVAEAGDDISTLEIPADAQPAKEESSSNSAPPPEKKAKTPTSSSSETHGHKYPLLPSVGHLVRQHGLSEADVSKIKGTGPSGRLLKGDILAHLGSIDAETPARISSRIAKLAHLDLSNIKVAERKEAPKSAAAEPEPEPVEEHLEIAVPISMAKVLEVQAKIRETLGVFLPLSTFINRAAEFANDDLPPAQREPTANELFDQVLGLDKIKAAKGSRGVYLPQIAAVDTAAMMAAPAAAPESEDILDILIAPRQRNAAPEAPIPAVPGLSSGTNLFSLVVTQAEEERAQLFLERCKVILEEEPGRLVL